MPFAELLQLLVKLLDALRMVGGNIAAADSNPRARGPYLARTDGEGMFSLGPISDPGGGVPAGTYTLTITTAHVESYDENTAVPPERVPPPYPTGVDFEVPEGGRNEADFDFSSK